MKKFIAILSGKKKGTLTDELLAGHISYLDELDQQGTLLLCGPFTDDDSAMQVLLCESLQQASEVIHSDPFVEQGYYSEVTLKELIEANRSNNWLLSNPQTLSNRSSTND